MPPAIRRLAIVSALLAVAPALHAQSDHGSIVVVTGQYPGLPIPTLIQGSSNQDVADLLFLRLARIGPTLSTSGDAGFIPQLAEHWTRRDSLTYVFDLDPRAHWQDGVPVTTRDVVFSFTRARDPAIAPALSDLLRSIESVTALDDHRVAIGFTHWYPSQFYDATYQVQILPAHLLEKLAPSAVAASDFARTPIGDGPYRWVRGVPGQFVELAADTGFFLGAPRLDRVIFRVAADANARMNLLLGGDGDALENILPISNQDRVRADTALRLVAVPSFTLGYFLYNERDPADTARQNPILGDRDVRRALTLAIDREAMAQSIFGPEATVPVGPASLSLWIRVPDPAARQDTALARRALTSAGWNQVGKDGIAIRNGRRLTLDVIFPNTSAARRQMALQAAAQWKAIGVDAQLEPLDFATYLDRRKAGRFDIDVTAVNQDPNPTGLTQSWTCAGIDGANVGHFCDPAVDSLIRAASVATDGLALWQQVLRRIDADAAAAFVFAPAAMIAVHRRYEHVVFHPESFWSGLGAWSVAPGRQLPRDRAPGR
ncbi:MAG TPA: peptide ABC transporter substrate-binding protein [Gemmatimonadales bacterium]|nr:peptide ABC transporter substrate-binding protein [Gemmatimonadales bacterium]